MTNDKPRAVTVPVAVARAVVASKWAAEHPPGEQDAQAVVSAKYKMACQNGAWARKLSLDWVDDVLAYREPITALLAEMGEVDRRSTTGKAIEAFDRLLADALEQAREDERREAQVRLKQEAATRAQRRLGDTRRRETPLSGQIEALRKAELEDICVDYGLDRDDPRVMAGLIAAFHSGARAFRQTIDGAFWVDPQEVPIEQMAVLKTRDAARFEKARAITMAATAPDPDPATPPQGVES